MRIKPLVVLSLVCSLSQAADTVAFLGDSIKATQFVTAVDHSKLINGTSKLRLSQDGVVSVGTDQSPLGNPVITIHAGSVFSADTAAHGKTFSTDLVLDYTYIDGVSGPLLIRTNGWVFVAPAEGSTLWCGPSDWPSYAFDLNNYNSESPTATLSSTDSDPSCSFSGTITITRPRGKTIPTIDRVLPGETILRDGYNDFETKGFVNYVFKGPYPYNTTIIDLNPGDIEFFNGSCGISGPSMGTPKYTWGIGKFQYNSYTYTLPYTDDNGSGDYTLVTTSMLGGMASEQWVNSHKWDWSTQVTNAPSFASTDHEHDHLTSDNGEWRLVQMDEGSAVVMPSYYYGENAQQGVSVKFYPDVPIEDVYDMNATQRTPMKLDIFVNGQLGAHADGYVLSRSPMYLTNKVIKISGVRLQDTISISYVTPFLGNSFSIMGVNMTGPEKKTLVSADYLRTKLADVSVNVQTAEDARVTLTNLITILKNL